MQKGQARRPASVRATSSRLGMASRSPASARCCVSSDRRASARRLPCLCAGAGGGGDHDRSRDRRKAGSLKEVKTEPIVIALAVDDADLADRLTAILAGVARIRLAAPGERAGGLGISAGG